MSGNKVLNTAAVPQFEYEVRTADNRVIIWYAPSPEEAIERMKKEHYKPVHIELYVPYVPESVLQEIEAADKQREWNYRLNQDIEMEARKLA